MPTIDPTRRAPTPTPPSTKKVPMTFLLTVEEKNDLIAYCNATSQTQTAVLRSMIRSLAAQHARPRTPATTDRR